MRIKELCALRGVSGNEREVRNYILEIVRPLCDEIKVDTMGNVICFKKAKKDGAKTLMLAAHMDEVGFIVQYIREDGLIRYEPVGGINPAVCVSRRVEVGKDRVPGVIGAKAIHLQAPAERTVNFTHDNLFIDIGAKDKADALKKVSIGDYVSFVSDYVEFGERFVKSRALDDRIGCAILLDVLEQGRYDVDLYAVFTVQEELGLHGAMVSAHRVNPDYAIVLECTTANDTPGAGVHEEICSVGKGPAISFMDRASVANPALFATLCKQADESGIPWQLKRGATGGNDAGAIQRAKNGVATCVISVPSRYIHSSVCVSSLNDADNARKLTLHILDRFDQLSL